MTNEERAAAIIDGLSDVEDAGDVVCILATALQVVLSIGSHNKNDALATLKAVLKDAEADLKENYEANVAAYVANIEAWGRVN